MKSDLDRLMAENDLAALLVTGPSQHNPALYYFTGNVHLTQADLLIRRGAEPLLFHNPMERDEAAQTGFVTKSLGDYPLGDLLNKVNGNYLEAVVLRYQQMFMDAGLTSGRVVLYGKIDAGAAFAIFSALQRALPDLTIVGEYANSLLLEAMATKDAAEAERIRRMGAITVAVVAQVADFLTSHRVKDGLLVKRDDNPLTIGEVKSRINVWLAERGAENPEGVIFAIGRDAGVPHSSGKDADLLRLGQTIVLDIFPCEMGGGYFYDLTRTWCLGYATDQVQAVYQDVLEVYQQLISEIQVNTRCSSLQERACDLFAARGHPTIQSDPKTDTGYTHSLGHGVGLNIHERPWFSKQATEKDRLAPGVVVTIEPGLYYPESGFGVRLENTLWVRPDGYMEVLAEYPMDLVLPVRR
jgi:Xaa-Pro aminopeptidase